MRKIKFRFRTLFKEMGLKRCLLSLPKITKYWGGRLIYIGTPLLALIIDWRKNWLKDMITGKIE